MEKKKKEYKVDDDFSHRLGEAIRTQRKRARISQEYLAEQLKTHPSYISLVEGGKRRFSVYMLGRVLAIIEADFVIKDLRENKSENMRKYKTREEKA